MTPREKELFEAWLPWLESEAKECAALEQGETIDKTLHDGMRLAMMPRPPVIETERERAYRRGYAQGYEAALADYLKATQGRTEAAYRRLEGFSSDELTRWRACSEPLRIEPPEYREAHAPQEEFEE
jgi:flagellar biosynthesis/type III secretory pathway protein FliH